MANITLKFGDYVFPSSFNVLSDESNSAVEVTAIPRRDGVVINDPTLSERLITVEGILFDKDDLRAALGELRAALSKGRQQLWLEEDRFTYAVKSSFTTDYEPGAYQNFCSVSIEFICESPFWYAKDSSSDEWSSPLTGNTRPITLTGTAEAFPTFEFDVADTGTLKVTLVLDNMQLILSGTAEAGQTLVVNSEEQTVTLKSDGSDKMVLFDGQFYPLQVGVNTLTYTNYGVPIQTITTNWRTRWY